MQHAILVPGAVAGLLLGASVTALNMLGGALSYGMRETFALVLMAAFAAAGQALAVGNRPLGPAAPFPARYFVAMFAGATTATVYGAIAWLHFTVLDPAHLERVYTDYAERARAVMGDAEYLAAAERMRGVIIDPLSQAMMQFGTALIIGLLTAVAVAALVARDAPPNPT